MLHIWQKIGDLCFLIIFQISIRSFFLNLVEVSYHPSFCRWGPPDKHCQRHNGPEGWFLLAKVSSLGLITISRSSIKFQIQNLRSGLVLIQVLTKFFVTNPPSGDFSSLAGVTLDVEKSSNSFAWIWSDFGVLTEAWV